ncbi:MAG: hypothetical protein MZV63_16355, partial [Marinilabiliales bacterium]|nr:hypothetical protein [Marinilabiliales bacterium]
HIFRRLQERISSWPWYFQGVDNYSGNFRFGLPHGTGIYTWANGSRYEGNWSKGMKDGAGKMVTRDSCLYRDLERGYLYRQRNYCSLQGDPFTKYYQVVIL